MAKRIEEDDEDLLEQEEMEEGDEEYEDEYAARRFRFLPALVVLAVVGGFGALAWHSYRTGLEAVKDDDVLLIEADSSPTKEKPADPGGMKFPHQDKTVFEAVANNAPKTPTVERVMPTEEKPVEVANAVQAQAPVTPASSQQANININREAVALAEKAPSSGSPAPASADGSSTYSSTGSSSGSVAAQNPVDVSEAPVASAPVEEKHAPVAKPVAVEKPKQAAPEKHVAAAPAEKKKETKPTVKEAAAKPKAVPATSSGTGVVQLGAYTTEEKAKEEWVRISKKFSTIMADKTVYYVKADLGAKGIFYRLRASGFKDSHVTCGELSAKGQTCMVVNGNK